MQICPVHHGSKRGIPHTEFAGNAEISVTSQGLFHSSSIQLYCASLTRPNHVFQHLFVLLQQPTAAVIAQNANEHALVVCEMRHTLDDIDVRMLRALARWIFRPTLHYNLAHFVQNTVGLFKVPALRPANAVRQMSPGQLKQRHSSCAILASHSPTRFTVTSTPDSAYSIPELRQEPLWFRCLGPLPAAHWTGSWSSCSAHIPGI